MWYVYMIRCADDSLYTGISTDVVQRFAEHASGGRGAARYLRGRGPLRLTWVVDVSSRSRANRVEARIKRLSKERKESIVRGRVTLADLGVLDS